MVFKVCFRPKNAESATAVQKKGGVHGTKVFKDAEELLGITDDYTEFPATDILNTLIDSIKHTDGVSNVFFNLPPSPAIWGGSNFTVFRNELAIELMCVSVSKIVNYNFAQSVNGKKADDMWRKLIATQGRDAGEALLLQHLVTHHGFQKYLDNKIEWLGKMEAILSNEQYIIGTVVKELTSETNLPVKMKLFVLHVLGSNKFTEITNLWKIHCEALLVASAIDFVNKENHLLFSTAKFQTDPFLGNVNSACLKSTTSSHKELIPGRFVNYEKVTDIIFGRNVATWINSNIGPKLLGLKTGAHLKNVKHNTHHGDGCFIQGTEIFCGDGNYINIEHLEVNDILISANGTQGLVSSEKVILTLENETAIFGFNNEPCFFLDSHPFWTQHGWCAINPHSAREENPWLEVGQLTEGDCVRKIQKDNLKGDIEYKWVEVKHINFVSVPVGTKVYGVHTREGLRSYHANGYLVMQNYPEITADRVQEGMKNLSADEQLELHKRLEDLSPLLENVVGPAAAKAVNSLAQNYYKGGEENTKTDLRHLVLPTYHLHKNSGCTTHKSYSMPSMLSLVRGDVYLDGIQVSGVSISDDGNISWFRQIDSLWEHGAAKLYENRLYGHAFISLTQSRNESHAVISAQFSLTVNTNLYKCYKSEQPIEKNKPPTSWVSFGEVEMGTVVEEGKVREVGLISIPPAFKKLSSLGNNVTFGVDSKQQLTIKVSVPVPLQSIAGYTTLKGVFNWDYSSFAGSCTTYDATKPEYKGKSYHWRGTIENITDDLLMDSRNVALNHSRHETNITLSDADNKSDQMTPMVNVLKNISAQHLSIEGLFTLTPPDSKSLHDLNFSLLQQAMKYEMPDDLREDVLGVVKPDLDGDMIDVANKHKSFLVDTFLNGYLMNGLSQNAHFKDKIDQDQRNQLLYFWAGSAKTSLSTCPGYTKVNNEISRLAFIRSCPDFKPYMASDTESWAKKLYDKLMEPMVLNALALAEDVSQTMKIIQKQAMVLYCLAPEKNYCKDFYNKILMTRLNITSTFYKGGKSDEENMKEFVKDYISQLIQQILSGGGTITGELNKEFQKQIQECAKELGVDTSKSAAIVAKDMMARISSGVDNIINLFNNATGTMWGRVAKSMEQWMENNPKFTKTGAFLCNSLFVAFWGLSLFSITKEFMNWKNLAPEQKVQLVLNTVALTVKTFSKLPDVANFLKESWKKSCEEGELEIDAAEDIVEMQNMEDVTTGIEEGIEQVESTMPNPEPISEAISQAASSTSEDITTLTRIFEISETFARVLGVVAMVGGCVAMGFQIARDFETGAPIAQKVLDILQETSFAVATVAATIGLFSAAVCLPVIGIVCAVIGLIISFVSLFIHRHPPKPKPTKADIYFSGTGVKFLTALETPTQKWLDDYHKRSKKSD